MLDRLVSPVTAPVSPLPRRTLLTETWLVLGVGLGASAIWSVLSIIRRLASEVPLSQQASQLNTSRATQSTIDLAYQLTGIALALVPALLALHLLAREVPRVRAYLGLDRSRPVGDLTLGALLALVIGVPGLLLYVGARTIGVNTTVSAASLGEHWWTVPVLVLSALQNSVLEEVVMVGYLFTRWTQAGWSTGRVVVVSALVRGCYHLYQGFGGFVGNVLMGLLLGAVYTRTRRVMPLVVAHTILDVVAFVGYQLLASRVGWL